MRQDGEKGDLLEVGALSAHVWARDESKVCAVIEVRIVLLQGYVDVSNTYTHT